MSPVNNLNLIFKTASATLKRRVCPMIDCFKDATFPLSDEEKTCFLLSRCLIPRSLPVETFSQVYFHCSNNCTRCPSSSIRFLPLPALHSGSSRVLEPITAILGRRRNSPWTVCRFIALTNTDSLELPINLTCMSLDPGRKQLLRCSVTQ